MVKGLLIFCLFSSAFASAQDRSYGRSMVVTPYGIVATSYVQASQAGARILEQGGSAIDAGIAANAVLGVAEPMMNGIGGDLFAIYWEAKTGKFYGLNASGWAPQGLTIDHLEAKGIHQMPQSGIDSVTVPGAVDGWTKLHDRFGKLGWNELFQPAIFYAAHGYAVPEVVRAYWEGAVPGLMRYPESRRLFLPGDKAPATGQIFRNPDLAGALTLIAQKGEAAFYKGEIAQAILQTSSELGGTMTAETLANTPRSGSNLSRPSTGIGRCMSFLPMAMAWPHSRCSTSWSTSQPSSDGPLSAAELHTRIESMKLAYADVKTYDGDPRFGSIPVTQLLSKDYAAKRARVD